MNNVSLKANQIISILNGLTYDEYDDVIRLVTKTINKKIKDSKLFFDADEIKATITELSGH